MIHNITVHVCIFNFFPRSKEIRILNDIQNFVSLQTQLLLSVGSQWEEQEYSK